MGVYMRGALPKWEKHLNFLRFFCNTAIYSVSDHSGTLDKNYVRRFFRQTLPISITIHLLLWLFYYQLLSHRYSFLKVLQNQA